MRYKLLTYKLLKFSVSYILLQTCNDKSDDDDDDHNTQKKKHNNHKHQMEERMSQHRLKTKKNEKKNSFLKSKSNGSDRAYI